MIHDRIRIRDLIAMLAVQTVIGAVSGPAGVYVSVQVMQNNIAWI